MAAPQPPTVGQVLFGIVVVVAAVLACASALHTMWRTGNWLLLLIALGTAGVAAGVVGQQSFPNQDAVRRYGADQASRLVPGPWEAGVHIPVVNLQATPVAVGGALAAVAGLSLVLFFEPVESVEASRRRAARQLPLAALEEEDTV